MTIIVFHPKSFPLNNLKKVFPCFKYVCENTERKKKWGGGVEGARFWLVASIEHTYFCNKRKRYTHYTLHILEDITLYSSIMSCTVNIKLL